MIRIVFYCLLFINVIYFLWALNQPKQDSSVELQSGLPTLMLASEIPAPLAEPSDSKEKDSGLETAEDPALTQSVNAYPVKPQYAAQINPVGHDLIPQERSVVYSDDTINADEPAGFAELGDHLLEEEHNGLGHALSNQPGNSGLLQADPFQRDEALLQSEEVQSERLGHEVQGQPEIHCYRLGAFASEDKARDLLQQSLLNQALSYEITEGPFEVPKGYWVLYPELDSYEAAEAKTVELEQRGIRDIWLFREGPRRGSISLGFFKSLSRARSQAEQLNAKGVQTDIQRWTETQSRYWITYLSSMPVLEMNDFLKANLPVGQQWSLDQSGQCAADPAE